MNENKKDIATIIEKEMPEFHSEVIGLSIEQLDARLVQIAKDQERVDVSKDNDAALEEAREVASQLAAPYRDAKKALKLKSKYIIKLLEEKGK